jgi:hypothetical protein
MTPRVARVKALREERQCSLQEAKAIEHREYLTALVGAATAVDDLKPVLLALIERIGP